jgi:hypothetical protein
MGAIPSSETDAILKDFLTWFSTMRQTGQIIFENEEGWL